MKKHEYVNHTPILLATLLVVGLLSSPILLGQTIEITPQVDIEDTLEVTTQSSSSQHTSTPPKFEITSSKQAALCGNEIVEIGEQCDLGSRNGEGATCSQDCKIRYPTQNNYTRKTQACGNAIVEGNEECDDGNGDNTDACTNICKTAVCGDGFIQPFIGEECDTGKPDKECNSICKKNEEEQNGEQNREKKLEEIPKNITPVKTTNNSSRSSIGTAEQIKEISEKQLQQQEQRNVLQKQIDAVMQKVIQDAKKPIERNEKVLDLNIENNLQPTQEKADDKEIHTVSIEKKEGGKILVCFTENGAITSDRTQCDTTSAEALRPEEIDDVTAKKLIRKEFLDEGIEEQKRIELLGSMNTAQEQLRKLLDIHKDSVKISTYLTQALAWLDRGIVYFSNGSRSIEETRKMVVPVRQLVTQATNLIAQEKPLLQQRAEIDPILVKTEQLLLKFRESFIALAQGGVSVEPSALATYIDAAEQFTEISAACAADASQCARIHGVLEILKEVQKPLVERLGQYPEIFESVQAKFAN